MTHGSPLAYSPTRAPDPHLIRTLFVDNKVNVITTIRMSEIHFQKQIQNTQIRIAYTYTLIFFFHCLMLMFEVGVCGLSV